MDRRNNVNSYQRCSFLLGGRESFRQIKDQQPSYQYITSILKVLVSIFYALRWKMENRTPNLVGLLLADAPYVAKYKAPLPQPTLRPVVYNPYLDKADKDVV